MKNVVSAAIIDFNNETSEYEILLEKHVKCKGLYVMPCGKVEDDDLDFPAALRRELTEELGIDPSIMKDIPLTYIASSVTTYDRIDGVKTFHEHVFEISWYGNILNVKNMEPEKHEEIIRVPLKEIINYCESTLNNGDGTLKLDKYSFLVYETCKNFLCRLENLDKFYPYGY